MTFPEAFRLTTSDGIVNQQVIDAIRNELAEAEAAYPSSRLHHAHAVLGMALLRMGNSIMDPMEFCPYYLESERAFLAALQHPDIQWAERYLGTVRRMLANRPTMDIAYPFIATSLNPTPRNSAFPDTLGSRKTARSQHSARACILVLACCRAAYLDRYVLKLLN